MRNYTHIDKYLDYLQSEIYPQPICEDHRKSTIDALNQLLPKISPVKKVLDIGCGQGAALAYFKQHNYDATGIVLGEQDYQVCIEKGYKVIKADMTFMDEIPDESFELVFSRHSLEHSPMPLLTLMEYNRVLELQKYVIIIVPNLGGLYGENHYSVFTKKIWKRLFSLAGFEITSFCRSIKRRKYFEYRFILKKVKNII